MWRNDNLGPREGSNRGIEGTGVSGSEQEKVFTIARADSDTLAPAETAETTVNNDGKLVITLKRASLLNC